MTTHTTLLRLPAVIARTGLSRSAVYRLGQLGKFPRRSPWAQEPAHGPLMRSTVGLPPVLPRVVELQGEAIMPEKIAALHGTGPGKVSVDPTNDNDTNTKWRRILRLLATGARLTRFDAEHSGDHALNSTVAALEVRGVRIAREPIVIEGRYGTIHCKRYWLEAEQRERAWAILGEQP